MGQLASSRAHRRLARGARDDDAVWVDAALRLGLRDHVGDAVDREQRVAQPARAAAAVDAVGDGQPAASASYVSIIRAARGQVQVTPHLSPRTVHPAAGAATLRPW